MEKSKERYYAHNINCVAIVELDAENNKAEVRYYKANKVEVEECSFISGFNAVHLSGLNFKRMEV